MQFTFLLILAGHELFPATALPETPCPEILCEIFCEYGSVLDENGCETCRCKKPACLTIGCALHCEYGKVLDANGCETCVCKDRPCSESICYIYCEFGNALDKNECLTCNCNENPCKVGAPLKVSGQHVYCGRGGQECPEEFDCVIAPDNSYAMCCPYVETENPCKVGAPLKVSGQHVYCGRGGQECPEEFDCVIAPDDSYAMCCPYVETDICQLPAAPGPCEAAILRWAFDPDLNLCTEFQYGGCEGNDNNFVSFDACRDACQQCPVFRCRYCENGYVRDEKGCDTCDCIDKCDLPRVTGSCKAAMSRYWHNPETRQCEHFTYGGCGGNANNFQDSEECFEACSSCPVPRCFVHTTCLRGFKKTGRGCQSCDCLEIKDICNMPVKPGHCKQYKIRYYRNRASRKCEAFVYGGCAGNENNFATMEACQDMCEYACPQVLCQHPCEHGMEKDERGCDTCDCIECKFGTPLLDNTGNVLFCGRGLHRQDCPEGSTCVIHPADRHAVCCSDTLMKDFKESCSPRDCRCYSRAKRTCAQRGLKDCKACRRSCPDGRCCCKKKKETRVTVKQSYGCTDPRTCHCFKTTCYQQENEYCKCKGCDKDHCCCDTNVETCDGLSCQCRKRGKRSCQQRGLAYCPPWKCAENCPSEFCCCQSHKGECPQETKDRCMTFCMDKNKVAVDGSECNGCKCRDVCALRVCPKGQRCVAQNVECVRAPCPPVPVCV